MRKTLVVTNDFPPRHGGIQSFVHELTSRQPAGSVVVYASGYAGSAEFDAGQSFPVVRHPTGLLVPTPAARVRIVHLRGYGVNFELLEFKEPRGDRRARSLNEAGSAHLCFVADDLDAELDRLKALGVRPRSPAPVTVVGGPNDGGKGIYLDDPDGNGVEILQLARPWPSETS